MGNQTLGFGLDTSLPFVEILQRARMARAMGFKSVWLSEDPFFRDSSSIIGALAFSIQRANIGTCIVNVYTKHPVYMAMFAHTMNELTNGMFALGIGRGTSTVIQDQMGISYGNYLEHMREYLILLRKLLSEENTTFDGKYYKIRNGSFLYRPPKNHVPIYVAGMGPKMLKLAGELGDGVMLNGCTSVIAATNAAKVARAAASASGRKEFRVICSLLTCIAENKPRAINEMRPMVGLMLSIPNFGELMLREINQDPSILPKLRNTFHWEDKARSVFWRLSGADRETVQKYVPDNVVDALAVCGTVDECKKRIRKYVAAGVDLPIVYGQGTRANEVLKLP